MKNLIALLLVLASATAFADTTFVDVNLHAHHWNRTDVAQHNLNEVNPGIGLNFTEGDYHKLIGVYKNSNRQWSKYALLAYTPVGVGNVHVGVVSGVVTGGYKTPYKFASGLYFIVNLTDKVNLNITAVPTVRSMNCYGFAGFQLSVKF